MSDHAWTCDGMRPYTEADARRDRGWRMRDGDGPSPRYRVYRALYALLQPLTFDERNEALAALRAAVGCGEAPRPECRPMTSEELAELIRGGHVEVGAHSVTHPVLSLLSPEQQRDEIRRGKIRLEAALGQPVTLFAYPYGMPGRHYSAESVMLVREAGYLGACTTVERAVSAASDRWELPRLVVHDWDGATLLKELERLG